jgi:hypothetical protein
MSHKPYKSNFYKYMKSFVRPFVYFSLICFALVSCMSGIIVPSQKINGASLVAPPKKFDKSNLQPLVDIGTNWISIMPYAYINAESGQLTYDWGGEQWWGETKEGVTKSIQLAHSLKLKTMLKPHVWINWGTFTGDFKPTDGYEKLKHDLESYLMLFASLAEEQKADLFCFGTEWKKFVQEEPAYFDSLITHIRSVYNGKLTYAANWDNCFYIPFWDKLDYIGIDAYFPLSSLTNPRLDSLTKAWKPWKQKIYDLSTKTNKPVLFTEYGFRNINTCAHKPWESNEDDSNNEMCQCHGYQSLFDTFWHESWFMGGFFWKYHTRIRNPKNNAFTPQNKEVWDVIKRQYLVVSTH